MAAITSDPKAGQQATSERQSTSRPAHCLSPDQVALELQTNVAHGLTSEDAAARLAKYGPNNLGKGKTVKPLEILFLQIFNPMSLVGPT